MKALVLCGGLGTRLRSVLPDIPKPMAPVGGKPFLDYILSWLKRQKIDDVILLTGYKSEQIEAHVKDGKQYGLNVEYSKEPEPLGTAGAIKHASRNYDLGDNFLLINGDTYFDVEIENLVKFHNAKSAHVTVTLRLVEDTSRYGLVFIDDNYRIIQFKEKTTSQGEGLINGGVYVMNSKVLELIPEDRPSSLEKDILPFLDKTKIFGYPEGGNFIDIGIPQDYSKSQEFLPKWESQPKREAVLLDRDGIIIEDTGYVHKKEEIKFMPGAIETIRKIKESGKLCIVVSNQAGIAKGYYTEEEALEFERAIEDEMKRYGARIDGFYYCPYHADGIIEKYRHDSIFRKPNPGMILKAANDFNISLSKSIMVGDKESDRIKLPQLKSYVIRSKYVSQWDFEDLKGAIICNIPS